MIGKLPPPLQVSSLHCESVSDIVNFHVALQWQPNAGQVRFNVENVEWHFPVPNSWHSILVTRTALGFRSVKSASSLRGNFNRKRRTQQAQIEGRWRNSGRTCLPQVYCRSGALSPLYISTLLWSNLPSELRSPSISSFTFHSSLVQYLGHPVSRPVVVFHVKQTQDWLLQRNMSVKSSTIKNENRRTLCRFQTECFSFTTSHLCFFRHFFCVSELRTSEIRTREQRHCLAHGGVPVGPGDACHLHRPVAAYARNDQDRLCRSNGHAPLHGGWLLHQRDPHLVVGCAHHVQPAGEEMGPLRDGVPPPGQPSTASGLAGRWRWLMSTNAFEKLTSFVFVETVTESLTNILAARVEFHEYTYSLATMTDTRIDYGWYCQFQTVHIWASGLKPAANHSWKIIRIWMTFFFFLQSSVVFMAPIVLFLKPTNKNMQ